MISFLKKLFTKEQINYPMLKEQGAIVIDVRSPQEFAQGHMKGSKNIPVGRIQRHIKELKKKGKPVILCCRSGARAASAAAILKGAGIEAYNGGSWTNVERQY